MKKIFFLAALIVTSLTSCSKDDSDSATSEDPNAIVLLKRSIQTLSNGEKITATYSYDGNRLLKTEYSNGTNDIYTYTDEKLSKLEVYKNNQLFSSETFTYGNTFNVTSYKQTSPDKDQQLYFKYINDKEIKVFTNPQFQLNQHVGVIQLNGDNVFQYTTINYSTHTYILDAKNSPLKNISANRTLAIARQKGGANNINQYIYSGVGTQGKGYTTTYTYNSKNYPTASEETNVNGEVTKMEYFYE